MNFMKYHVSRNLTNIPDYSERLYDFYYTSDKLLLSNAPAGTYTLSAVIDTGGTDAFMAVGVGTTGYNADLAQSSNLPDGLKTLTFTISGNNIGKNVYARFVRYYSPKSVLAKISNVMLNTGSTALPYDPPGNTWLDSHYIKETATDTITTLPAIIYPLGQTASIGLKGNTVQNGTPTPSAPVMPQGTGDRTANLCASTSTLSGTLIVNVSNIKTVVLNDDFFELSFDAPNLTFSGNSVYLHTDSINRVITTVNGSGHIVTTFKLTAEDINSILASNTNYFYVYKSGADFSTVSNVGLYGGYKIPISSANTTTPVYLGEVQTTRRVRKWVLKGDEDGWFYSSGFVYNQNITPDYLRSSATTLICSHYKAIGGVAGGSDVSNGQCALYRFASVQRLYIMDNNYTTAEDFKTYLAQQYAAGTPVCVWYVLATEETAVVNEPLMKIGSYADSISGISIPTTAGANTLDILTTLKPSEVTAIFKGWHPVSSAHERDNGAWT